MNQNFKPTWRWIIGNPIWSEGMPEGWGEVENEESKIC